MNVDSCFPIAYVLKSHGLKGEVTLTLLPECPSFDGIQSVFLQIRSQLVPHFIESSSVKGIRAYVKFEGVNSAEDAEGLRGSSIYLPRSLRPGLPKGEFYSDEVKGFTVEDARIGLLGSVTEVLETGAGRHLVVVHQGKDVLIPLNGPFIKSVNKLKRSIRVDLPDGLLDL